MTPTRSQLQVVVADVNPDRSRSGLMTPARTGWELGAFSLRRRHHHRPRLTAVLAFAVLVAACGTQTSPTAPVISINPVGSTIKAAYLSQVHATVLVNDAGYALYMFLPNHQRVSPAPGCAPRTGLRSSSREANSSTPATGSTRHCWAP